MIERELCITKYIDPMKDEKFSNQVAISHVGDLRDSSLICEATIKSTKLSMLKVTSDLMEESREGQKLGLYLLDG
ncbi:hypothetical protein CR513_47214, partial [Mucuna pruriens]